MYDQIILLILEYYVTGPCEFLVMYDIEMQDLSLHDVTGPCEFLVMYDILKNKTN